jgi:hypothetical protein
MQICKYRGLDELAELRFECKKLASILSMKPRITHKKVAMRRITNEVRDGNPRLRDLEQWYPIAKQLIEEL